MLGAVVLSVAPQVSRQTSQAPVALALLPLAAGVAIATQQALNGQVAAAAAGEGDRSATRRSRRSCRPRPSTSSSG